ncbi:hypothetical protein KV697_14160 [Sphingomonas sanguinis]|uniref:hypothetical protein n=1 Tax=Sphingomonas sanguinis TaxID=33051 RepID=UPI001C564890|nr:hypothetical protein [Sphingomonas sanguinis]QXT34914.1 hypothetical protein KV697_14160 [Sphingomonas sanguinis]
MKPTDTLLIVAVLTIAVPAAAAPAPAGMSPLRMDVAGVRLAMPIEQVRTALAAASYACTPFGNEADFAARVAAEVKDRTGAKGSVPYTSGTMQLDCRGPNGEGLTIRFAQVRSGSIVDNYSLRIDGRTVDLPELRRQLARRYGRPMVGTELRGSWCDAGYRCGESMVFSEGPTVIIDTTNAVTINATRGIRAEKADDAAVMAAADRQVPRKTRAAF